MIALLILLLFVLAMLPDSKPSSQKDNQPRDPYRFRDRRFLGNVWYDDPR